jgi:hypothetical protein
MKEQVIGFVLVTIGVIANSKYIQNLYREVYRKLMPHDAIVRSQIQMIVDNLATDVRARKVCVWQMNNGTKSELGYSYKYGSIIFESNVHTLLKPVKKMFTNLPVEDYIPFLRTLQESDRYTVNKSSTAIPIIRNHYDFMGGKYGIEYKLDSRDVYKGFIVVVFDEMPCSNKCDGLCEAECDEIKMIAAAAAAIHNRIKMIKKINS